MKKLKLVTYLKLSYFLIAIIPLLLLIFPILSIFNHQMLQKIHESNIEKINQVKNLTEQTLNNVEGQTYTLLSSTNMMELTAVSEKNKITAENLITGLNLIKAMKNIQKNNLLIETIYILNKDTNLLVTSHGYIGDVYEYNHLEFINAQTSSNCIWTYTHETNNSVITSLNILMTKETSNFLHQFNGTLYVNLDENYLESYLKTLKNSDDSTLTIIDRDGTIISTTNNKNDLSSIINAVLNVSEDHGYIYDDKYNVYYYAVDNNDWIYLQNSSTDNLKFAIIGIIPIVSIIVSVIVLIVIIISHSLSQKIYSPLAQLLQRLMPINPDNVIEKNEYEMLDDVITSIQQEKSDLSDFISHNKQSIKDNLIRKLLHGVGLNDVDLKEKLKYIEFPIDMEFYFAIYLDVTLREDDKSFTEEMWPTWHQVLLRLIEVITNENFICMGITTDEGNIAMIAGANDIDVALRASNQFIRLAINKLSHRIQIIHGGYYNSIMDIATSYRQAREIAGKKVFSVYNTVINYNDISLNESIDSVYPHEEEVKIIASLRQKDIDAAMMHLTNFMQDHNDAYVSKKEVVENNCIFLIATIIRELNLMDKIKTKNMISDFINHDKYVGQIKAWFLQYFNTLISHADINDEKYDSHKEMIDAYIVNNYNKNISLEQVADAVGLSYSYVRKIFAGLFGCGFSYYLNVIRIEKVKELLENSSKSIDSIAQLTGFNSKPSFYRNFKSITGFTPSDYRKQLKVEAIMTQTNR